MPLSPMLVQWLSENGHDALHAAAIGLHRAPDTEIMSHAKDEGRIVVTADLDYPRLLALSAAIEPSLILFRGGNWDDDEIVARMATLLASVSEADFERSIFVVEPQRIRRRHLPVS
jgi:predicted nuclease of predicted toxin-antitoxin system